MASWIALCGGIVLAGCAGDVVESQRMAECFSICDGQRQCSGAVAEHCAENCYADFERARPSALHDYQTCLSMAMRQPTQNACDRYALYCYVAAMLAERPSTINQEFADRCYSAYGGCDTSQQVNRSLDCSFSTFFVDDASRDALGCFARGCGDLHACIHAAFVPPR